MKRVVEPEIILQSAGIDVSNYDASFLRKSLQKRITETQSSSAEAYYNLVGQDKEEVRKLLDSLNICYSEFFRNSLTYSVLERIILPSVALKKKNTNRKEIRIWSAACASGQEAYSLAILLEEFSNLGNQPIDYRIFATDHDPSQVNKAMIGSYSEDALNCLNLKRVKQWFTKGCEIYTVKEVLKKNIDFSVFDLYNEQSSSPPTSIFGDFDVVVCANLLFYYNPGCREKIIEKTGDCLTRGGYLITGETEREILLKHDYFEVYPQSAIFQKI
jgi:chemotaxis methyl-accepting protein methylase